MKNDDFDFGFTTESDESTVSRVAYDSSQERLQKMYDTIIPLIDNLAKDADKNPVIKWPNRKEKLLEFKAKLDSILKG